MLSTQEFYNQRKKILIAIDKYIDTDPGYCVNVVIGFFNAIDMSLLDFVKELSGSKPDSLETAYAINLLISKLEGRDIDHSIKSYLSTIDIEAWRPAYNNDLTIKLPNDGEVTNIKPSKLVKDLGMKDALKLLYFCCDGGRDKTKNNT